MGAKALQQAHGRHELFQANRLWPWQSAQKDSGHQKQ
jgi:hypothetical protein